MNSQSNIFGRTGLGSSTGLKKGQMQTSSNIFGNAITGIGTGISSNSSSNPFANLFNKPINTSNTNTSNTGLASIFGQKSGQQGQNTGISFMGKSNTQNQSPFSQNTSQTPFSKLGQTGQSGQIGQSNPNNTGVSFASIFNANKSNTQNNQTSNFFGNQPQSTTQNIFGQNNQTSTFTIGQQPQQNTFPFQQQNQNQNTLFNQNQQQSQPLPQIPLNIENALNSYLQGYQNQLGNKMPFGQTQQDFNTSLAFNPKYPFDPTKRNDSYYNFLNHLLRDQTVKKYASPAELAHFASQWADHNLSSSPQEHQVHKLFDAHALPHPSLKFLPPADITPELIESLNDPVRTKDVLSTLAAKIHLKLQVFKQTLLMCDQSLRGNSAKIKDLPCFKEIAMIWTELKAFQRKVKEMVEKDHQIEKKGYQLDEAVKVVCRDFKEGFVDVNRHVRMVQQSHKEVQELMKYLECQIQPIFKGFITSTPQTIQDPDDYLLAVAASLTAKIDNLAKNLDECLFLLSSTQDQEEETDDVLILVQNLCLYYQKVAEEVFRVNEKIRKTVGLMEREKHWKQGQMEKKLREKVRVSMTKKLEAYNLINEIQHILFKRQLGPEVQVHPLLPPLRNNTQHLH